MSRQDLKVPDCTALGRPLVDHACQHAMFGPFQMVTTDPNADYPGAQPNLNAVHTHYTVTLSGGAAGAHTGTVKYRPQRTGHWVVFTHPAMEVAILNAAGATLSSSHMEQVPSCTDLGIGRVYELTANETYRLRFDASASPQAEIIIERLEDFEQFFYADADQDGFGDPASSVTTACTAPAGFVADDTDCDDTNAMAHVDVEERCDDDDNDCDGRTDEQLDCSAGDVERDAGSMNQAIGHLDASTEMRGAGDAMNTGDSGTAAGAGSAAPALGGSGGAAASAGASGSPAETDDEDDTSSEAPGSVDFGAEASSDKSDEKPSASKGSSGCQAVAPGQAGRGAWSWSIASVSLLLARGFRRRTTQQHPAKS